MVDASDRARAEEQLHELALMAVTAGMFDAAAFLYDRLSRGDTRMPKQKTRRLSPRLRKEDV